MITSSPFWLSIKCIRNSNSELKTAQQHLACCHAESGASPNKQRVRLRDSSKIRKNCQRVLQIIHLSRTRNNALTVCTSVWGLDYPKYERKKIIDISGKSQTCLVCQCVGECVKPSLNHCRHWQHHLKNAERRGSAQKRIGTRDLINHWLLLWEVNQLVCFSELPWGEMSNSHQNQEWAGKQIAHTLRRVSLSPLRFHR